MSSNSRSAAAAVGNLPRVVPATGTLAAEDQVVVNTKVAGRLDALPVDLGTVVRQGDVVAVLDPTDFRLRVERAETALAQARARLTAQMRAEESETHLTPDQLSAQLDGALEGASFDLIRHHLAGCEEYRLQCMRMASADDVLRALLVHEPDESFFEALAAFLEEEYEAKEAAGWIPPPLESAIAAETARLTERRWSAVGQAVPRPFVLPASAVRPLDASPTSAAASLG